jgi:hypothetical protein
MISIFSHSVAYRSKLARRDWQTACLCVADSALV